MLWRELATYRRKAETKNAQLAVRLNLLSDIRWEKIYPSLFKDFPHTIFYDYTKHSTRFGRLPPNYHLVFSRSEKNEDQCLPLLKKGTNVAIVFRKKIPKLWKGVKVVNGDKHDLIFLHPSGNVIGLKAKGSAKKDDTGFVI